jgi:hypothetical protein
MSFLSRLPGDLKQQLQRERMKDVLAELLEVTKNMTNIPYTFSRCHPFCFVQRDGYTWPTFEIGKCYWSYFSGSGWLTDDMEKVISVGNLTVSHSKTNLRQYLK